MTYEITEGGHIIIFSAGTYEAAKTAILEQLSAVTDQSIRIDIRDNVDAGTNVIDLKISVYKDSDKIFTVNLYNTTSRALINGKHPEVFQDLISDITNNLDQKQVKTTDEMLLSIQNITRQCESRTSARAKKRTNKAEQLLALSDETASKRSRMSKESKPKPNAGRKNGKGNENIRSAIDTVKEMVKACGEKGNIEETITQSNNPENCSLDTPESCISCIICDSLISTQSLPWECTGCLNFTHQQCDPTPCDGSDASLPYLCPLCRHDKMVGKYDGNAAGEYIERGDSPTVKKHTEHPGPPPPTPPVDHQVPAAENHNKKSLPMLPMLASTDPVFTPAATQDQNVNPIPGKRQNIKSNEEIGKELKAKEKDLKAWEKSLHHRAQDLTEVIQQLAASRITIDRLEYENKQLAQSIKLLQEARATPAPTTTNPTQFSSHNHPQTTTQPDTRQRNDHHHDQCNRQIQLERTNLQMENIKLQNDILSKRFKLFALSKSEQAQPPPQQYTHLYPAYPPKPYPQNILQPNFYQPPPPPPCYVPQNHPMMSTLPFRPSTSAPVFPPAYPPAYPYHPQKVNHTQNPQHRQQNPSHPYAYNRTQASQPQRTKESIKQTTNHQTLQGSDVPKENKPKENAQALPSPPAPNSQKDISQPKQPRLPSPPKPSSNQPTAESFLELIKSHTGKDIKAIS